MDLDKIVANSIERKEEFLRNEGKSEQLSDNDNFPHSLTSDHSSSIESEGSMNQSEQLRSSLFKILISYLFK